MSAERSPASTHAAPGVWQRAVPVDTERLWGPSTVALFVLAAVGFVVAAIRMISPLAPFSGMNDAYPWGVWKTFNVMTLTALGSGALGVGLAAWVLNRHKLHVVMRVALVTSFLFYLTGILSLGTDVGRPWNMWRLVLPWQANAHSPLFEVALAMPVYCLVFLAYENSPAVVERIHYRGSARARAIIARWQPRMRAIYPFAIAGAYLLPLGHQSSLGALMLLAGEKVDPLWQSPLLPYLYLGQAIQAGFAFMMFILMASCLTYRRPVDMPVLAELASLYSWSTLAWVALRLGDIVVRGKLGYALALGVAPALFWAENAAVLIPAVAFRFPSVTRSPGWVFRLAVMACAGGMLYRFSPTMLVFSPGGPTLYFPALGEVMVSLGFLAFALGAYTIALKTLAILPAPLTTWVASIESMRAQTPELPRDRHGNPIDD